MKYATIFIALLLAIVAVPAATAAVSSIPSLNASLLYYEPVPATPGSVVDVYVQITNNGASADSVEVRFIDNGPFALADTGDRVKTTPTIPGGESFLVKYTVRISEDAVPGTNSVKIEYQLTNSMNTQTALLPITISSSTVSLSIVKIQLQPEMFVPGNVGRIIVTLKNDADQKVSSGVLRLELADVDLIPIQSTNQERFTDLPAGAERQFTFSLTASPSMTPGVYKVPVSLNFTDQQGNDYEMSEVIGVRVGATPDISIAVDEVAVAEEGNEVFIRVTNKGIGEVKFVNIVLHDSETYELDGSNERYIGNIDSDDYKTARVLLDANEDQVSLPVTVTYMDSLNTPYTTEKTLTFKAKTADSGPSTGVIVLIVIILVGIAAYFILRRKRR